ncbi:MAG: methylated-DNA--[protein]-cysteine S-methyltransferase [Flavobacteriales bacterium]|nr:methylated-DNA--[protein]-cysteine S-methyltransferase [Flavobacteriales bacterium]
MNETFQHIVDTPLGWFNMMGSKSAILEAHWIAEEDAVVGNGGGIVPWKRMAEDQLREYFQGKRDSFSLPLLPRGTEFQQAVWKRVLHIPKGTTKTYSALAQELGGPERARPVGTAIGANPLLLLIPCHRVIGSDGALTGYAGGLRSKEWLLHHEGAIQQPQLRLF